jgi:1-phosphofructokinase
MAGRGLPAVGAGYLAAMEDANDEHETRPGIAIFAPTTQLSITVESTAGADDLHVHAAGQGYWVARMLSVLGEHPLLCTPLGGETGVAVRALLRDLPADGLVPSNVPNGGYVHDRRGGERHEIAMIRCGPLDRHTIDDLVSAMLACGIGAPVAVVCGTNADRNIEVGVFERICRDLRVGGTAVVADLSGDELRAALAGEIAMLKISSEEMVKDGWSPATDEADLWSGIAELQHAGAGSVVASCEGGYALAALRTRRYRVRAPEMSVVDHRGVGDSMTAALASGLRAGLADAALLQIAAAASAVNVTRHGLASGRAEAIHRLAELVEVVAVAEVAEVAEGAGSAG